MNEADTDATSFYNDVPDERIDLTLEPSYIYPDMPQGSTEVRMANLKPFLLKTFFEAHRDGHLGRTAQHYVEELAALDAFDEPSLTTFRQLAREAHDNRHDKNAMEITNSKLREMVGNFKIIRRGK